MSSMSGYMLKTGQHLQDIKRQRRNEKEQPSKIATERPFAGRQAAMLNVETSISDRPFMGRSGTSMSKASADSDDTVVKKERGFNIFGHRRKKRSKDLGNPSDTSPISRFEIPGLRSASPVFGFRSTSPAPPEMRATSPIPSSGLRTASPIPPSHHEFSALDGEIRISLERTPSASSSSTGSVPFLLDIPEQKTNLSANDILFGGRENIPPPPPPKPFIAPMIPNPKEDPLMSLLSGATVIKPKIPMPKIPVPRSPVVAPLPPPPSSAPPQIPLPVPVPTSAPAVPRSRTAALPPLTTSPPVSNKPISSRSGGVLPMPVRDTDLEHNRKPSQSSDFESDGILDKKRQHWLCPESPHRNIINEKLYNELPLEITETQPEPMPVAPVLPPEKDPALFAPRREEEVPDIPEVPPPPFEEEEPEHYNPEFTENLKSHLKKSDIHGEWWRAYAPPPELSYIPENTPMELLNLYNDEQLEYDIKRIQSKAPKPVLEIPVEAKGRRREEDGAGSSDDVGYSSHRASTHTAEGTIFSRRSIATTATSVSDVGVTDNLSPVSPAVAPASAPPQHQPTSSISRWTTFSKWGPNNHDSILPAYSPMRESFLNGAWSPRRNDNGCAMCMEDLTIRRMIAIDCNHKYCNACLRSIILASLNDEIAFPPKCCTARIPVKAIKTVCNLAEQSALNHKIREYSQQPQDRVYCPSQSCGRYIPPESVTDFRTKYLVCQYCQTRVCSACKSFAHFEGSICPKEDQGCITCRQSKSACLCKSDEEKIFEWGKTRFYESTHPEEYERRMEEIHAQGAIADAVAYERKAANERKAVEEALKQRRDKERMEQRRKEEARMTDLSKKYDRLTSQLEMLEAAQSALMERRLAMVRAELLGRHEEGEARHEAFLAEEDETLEHRVSEKSQDLQAELDNEMKLLDAKFEEEEDDIIMVLTRRHRGKPNQDERINSAVDRLKHQQEDEKEEARNAYNARFDAIRHRVLEDIDAAKQDINRLREIHLQSQYEEWREAARREFADEKWVEAVREFRREHLAVQFEAQKDEYRMKKLEAELEESFKLAMLLELEDERDRVYSSPRGRDTPVKPLAIRGLSA